MRVVIYAEDLSGRKDDGYYTKPDVSAALDIFFKSDDEQNFYDSDTEEVLTRAEAEELFREDGRLTFYNGEGEKVVIALDPSSKD